MQCGYVSAAARVATWCELEPGGDVVPDRCPALRLRPFDLVLLERCGTVVWVSIGRFVGVDLAWGPSRPGVVANETGVAALDAAGRVLDAGWARGLDETVGWVLAATAGDTALAFIDAPLIVDNTSGQRLCETQVGQRYGRWKVSANTTNIHSLRLAGVELRQRLEIEGWRYSDGLDGPPVDGRTFSECYPYTTLVGAAEFGYEAERPRYKRSPRKMPAAQWRVLRAASCDELIQRLGRLKNADPPLDLDSHPVTHQLVAEPSPLDDVAYKHREDLIDALLCAWTAALWTRYELTRCQVLGPPSRPPDTPAATIIAPARAEQRRRATARIAACADVRSRLPSRWVGWAVGEQG